MHVSHLRNSKAHYTPENVALSLYSSHPRGNTKKKKKSGRWIGTRQISFGIKTPLWRRTESTRDHRREKLEEGGRETRRERNINGKGGGGVFRNRGKNTLTWRTWLLSDICIEI